MNTIPTVTKNLLIINVLMFLGTIVAQSYGIDLAQYLGLHFFLAEDFNAAQLITYMFMHAGFAHIFFNMFAAKTGMSPEMINTVYQEGAQIIRDNMNYTYPPMANLNALLNGVTVGASGAVYAILLGFGMLFPNQPLFIFPLPFPIKAKYFVIGYALIELYAGFANNPNDNVAHFAHLGGMVFGFILIMYWRKKEQRKWLLL